MFHQSGGCCDGSSPMCYPDGEFIVGDRDILLAVLDVGAPGCRCGSPARSSMPGSTPSWSSTSFPAAAAVSAWKPPRACGSCPAAGPSPTPRTHLLAEAPPVTGSQYSAGARPSDTGSHIVDEAADACPVPGGRARADVAGRRGPAALSSKSDSAATGVAADQRDVGRRSGRAAGGDRDDSAGARSPSGPMW